MLKYKIKPILYFLIIFGVFFVIIKCVKDVKYSQIKIEQAKTVIIEQAKEALGEEPNIVYERFERKNMVCWIGCVNSRNTHAIMYIAKQNKYTETWRISVFSEREGANAASLFAVNHSMQTR